MAKLTSMKHSAIHRALVFGEPKSGKTELAAKLAEKFNILYIGLENGHETLFKLPQAWQERIEVVNIPDTKVFPIGIETSLKIITGAPVEVCDEHGKVNCAICKKEGKPSTRVALNELDETWVVVFDSLTQLSNSAMNHLTKGQPDDYKPEWTDYRNQGQLLDKFLSQVQQAKFNIVCITHVVETELEDGRKKLVPVCGTTQFSRNTAKYFDHVVYCEIKNKKHNFASSTTYANNVLTGSRTDVALENAQAPSLLAIFNNEIKPISVELDANQQASKLISDSAKSIAPKQEAPKPLVAGSGSAALAALKSKALNGGK